MQQRLHLVAFYFHILTTMHGQNHIKFVDYQLLHLSCKNINPTTRILCSGLGVECESP